MEEQLIALAESARGRNLAAFERLVRSQMQPAYYFALGLVRNREDALDVSQTAFAKAWQAIGSLREGRLFPAWFHRILRNEAMNHLKRARVRRTEELEFLTLADPASERDPAESAELTHRVAAAVAALPLELREIIVLKHFQGLDYDEIAALLAIPRGSVASRLYRARAALREKLATLAESREVGA